MIRTFSASSGAYIAHRFPDLLQRNKQLKGMQVSSLLQPKTSKVSFFFLGGNDHLGGMTPPLKKIQAHDLQGTRHRQGLSIPPWRCDQLGGAETVSCWRPGETKSRTGDICFHL